MVTHEHAECWIELPSEEEVRAHVSSGHSNPYDFGFLPRMSRLLLAHGDIGPLFRGLFRAVMFADGHLSRREREMVAAVASAAQDCHY